MRRDRVLGVVLLVVAVVFLLVPLDAAVTPMIDPQPAEGWTAFTRIPMALPAVAFRPAFAVLLAWSGLVRIVLARRGPLAVVLADLALTAPVTVFLVALANGVIDVLALVPLYALMTSAWLLAVLQTRVRVERGHPLLPLCFAAGAGIVPWGVIALAQVVGHAPGPVRIATLIALAAQLLVAVLLWRAFRRDRAVLVDVISAVSLVVVAPSVVLAVAIGSGVFV